MAEPFQISFVPDRQRYTAAGPVEIFLAAAACGIVLEQPCGSLGTCGNCRVRIVAGDVPPGEADRLRLSEAELRDGWRLACQLVVDRAVTVNVPPQARSLAGKSFDAGLAVAQDRVPIAEVRTVHVEPASLALQESDLDRVTSALGLERHHLSASAPAIAGLRRVLTTSDTVRVVIHDAQLVEAFDPRRPFPLGLALDIGSTSLAAALVDFSDGRVVCSDSRLNPQVSFGADVISRIHFTVERPDGLEQLTAAVRGGVRELVHDLLSTASRDPEDVVLAGCAGNPTMIHAWAGVPIAPLGTSPYVGAWSAELNGRASELGLPILPDAPVYVFPMVRSHVGSDAVGAAIATGLDRVDRPTLLIDLGTNTEVMVASAGRFAATSAAAGPAFEGGSITHGMRAAPGAIDAVAVTRDGRVAFTTIGNRPARGICGSGLIDAVAELLRAGAISTDGFLRTPDGSPGAGPNDLSARFITVEGQHACVLARGGETAPGQEILLTARDVRQLQLVKGSIVAAATILCRESGLDPRDLHQVFVAGAFGNYIRKASALRIGLVPLIDPERVQFVGNAAGVAARLALCDRRVRHRARDLAARAEYVELATHADYQSIFLGALAFPDAGTVRDSGPSPRRGER